jgi:hypothetical protein
MWSSTTGRQPALDVALALHGALAAIAAEDLLMALGEGRAAPEAAHVQKVRAPTDNGAA